MGGFCRSRGHEFLRIFRVVISPISHTRKLFSETPDLWDIYVFATGNDRTVKQCFVLWLGSDFRQFSIPFIKCKTGSKTISWSSEFETVIKKPCLSRATVNVYLLHDRHNKKTK